MMITNCYMFFITAVWYELFWVSLIVYLLCGAISSVADCPTHVYFREKSKNALKNKKKREKQREKKAAEAASAASGT